MVTVATMVTRLSREDSMDINGVAQSVIEVLEEVSGMRGLSPEGREELEEGIRQIRELMNDPVFFQGDRDL